ncbi:MAG: threonine/serine dehydratase [Rhodospirillales bacterium]|nr:threonine/serine dehydratase [Rhodospirillales bacterium]
MSSSAASETSPRLPSFADIEDAARRLVGQAVVTPLLESHSLNARLGGRLLVKAEPLQRTGSFKFRGAYNRMSRLDAEARRRGVVAYSSGNHAQGVAAAAQILAMPATIIMPTDAPAIKVTRTRGYGAEVIQYDRYRESREEIGGSLAAERGATLVPPYDDPYIVAGQGTIGLEIARQAEALGVRLDAVLVCCGGGGLISGTALALATATPGTKVYAVEPAGFDDTTRSLKSGRRERNDPSARSICDALLSPEPGALTFALNARLLAGGLVVTDDEVRRAMATAFAELKLVTEPGGAVALAAALTGKISLAGKTVAVVCSGGNVDPETFCAALQAA